MDTGLLTPVVIGIMFTLGLWALGVSLLVLAPQSQGTRPIGLPGAFPADVFEQDIGLVKTEQGTDVFSPAREEEVIQNVLESNKGPLDGGTLRAIYREAIFLSDVEGFTVREIAAILGCPEGTVKARLSRGRLALRRMLREKGQSRRQEAVR